MYLPTKERVTDYLSKPLQGSLFTIDRNSIIRLRRQHKSYYFNLYKMRLEGWTRDPYIFFFSSSIIWWFAWLLVSLFFLCDSFRHVTQGYSCRLCAYHCNNWYPYNSLKVRNPLVCMWTFIYLRTRPLQLFNYKHFFLFFFYFYFMAPSKRL